MHYMVTPNDTINVTNGFGLRHPKKVSTLLEAAAALDQANTEAPGWDGVLDPKKVASVVRANAEHTVTTGQALTDASNQARQKIAYAVTEAVTENLDEYLDQLEERFRNAAEEYTKAAQELPREFNSEDVTRWEPGVFDAYARAKQANGTIEATKQWLLNLGRVVRTEKFDPRHSSEFLVLSPEALEGYVSIQTANGSTTDPALRAVNPVRLKAVKDGIPLSVSLPSEVKESIKQFESQRQALSQQESIELRNRAKAY
ncbi:hypothetical protein NUW87_04865 [Corynebacterium pilbarense]|uniref:Uncharacterized protein n=1 Tax=Corynebacterium pilbarense TaxID=1288393 RepID=A0A9Q4NRW1_9CORY|nr:hypothetical protein [Corynebacterium pilbarense]MCZ2220705.1 hypothetical protein [Corynebacterium pilbarense]